MEPSQDTHETPTSTGSARALVREFFEGAVRPSLPALLGTLAVAGLLFGACAVLISPRYLARINEGYFMASNDDSYASLTGKVFQRRVTGFDDNSVVIIGSSSIHHAFPDADVIERDIEEVEPIDVHVVPLIGNALSMWEMYNILGEVKGPIDGVVVLGISAGAFCKEDSRAEDLLDNPRLPFLSDAYREELKRRGIKLPTEVGVYFIDYSSFFTARIRSTLNFVSGPRHFRRVRDVAAPLHDPGKWDRAMATIGERLQSYDENAPPMYELLADLVAFIRSKGDNRVVILEPPFNPVAIADMGVEPTLEKYRVDMAAFAREHDVEFWRLCTEEGLDPEDFADWYHLRDTPTRERYTREFADRIAKLMAQMQRGAGS